MDRTIENPGHWALAATFALHALLAMWWWNSTNLAPAPTAETEGLQIVWIERPQATPAQAPAQAQAQAQVPAASPAASETATAAERSRRLRPLPAAPVRADPTAALPTARPLSVIALAEVAAAERAAGGHDFRRNPLHDPPPPLGATAPERFRVQEPLTVAAVAAGIGQLFGGAGYETSPCPRIRRNIAARRAGGDDAALAEELRRLQAHCL